MDKWAARPVGFERDPQYLEMHSLRFSASWTLPRLQLFCSEANSWRSWRHFPEEKGKYYMPLCRLLEACRLCIKRQIITKLLTISEAGKKNWLLAQQSASKKSCWLTHPPTGSQLVRPTQLQTTDAYSCFLKRLQPMSVPSNRPSLGCTNILHDSQTAGYRNIQFSANPLTRHY